MIDFTFARWLSYDLNSLTFSLRPKFWVRDEKKQVSPRTTAGIEPTTLRLKSISLICRPKTGNFGQGDEQANEVFRPLMLYQLSYVVQKQVVVIISNWDYAIGRRFH